jgi:stage II sporulation protein D
MMKNLTKELSIFICLLVFFAIQQHGIIAFAGTPAKSVTYKTEVKVKLLPISSISFKITGKYELVNLDSGQTVPFSGTINSTQKDGKILVTAGGKSYFSAKGFNLNEVQPAESNSVEITSIKTAGGVMPASYRGSFEIRTGSSELLLFNRLDMENYLKGVVPSEMPPSWHLEALKAQAVAARSYAYTQIQRNKQKGYLEMTVSSQVYGGKSKEHPRSSQAVQETAGLYAVYNNVPIEAVFHSSSGGYTENSENVWSSAVPYIKAVPDPYDNNNSNYHYGWESIAYAKDLNGKLGLSSSDSILSLNITKRGPSSAAQQVEAVVYNSVNKTTASIPLLPGYGKTPDSLRSLFGISLKSIKFDITTDSAVDIIKADGSIEKAQSTKGKRIMKADGSSSIIEDLNLPVKSAAGSFLLKTAPSSFTFKGNGWGHLLGMSQWGARGMAEAGYTYQQIVKHYYTGTELKPL